MPTGNSNPACSPLPCGPCRSTPVACAAWPGVVRHHSPRRQISRPVCCRLGASDGLSVAVSAGLECRPASLHGQTPLSTASARAGPSVEPDATCPTSPEACVSACRSSPMEFTRRIPPCAFSPSGTARPSSRTSESGPASQLTADEPTRSANHAAPWLRSVFPACQALCRRPASPAFSCPLQSPSRTAGLPEGSSTSTASLSPLPIPASATPGFNSRPARPGLSAGGAAGSAGHRPAAKQTNTSGGQLSVSGSSPWPGSLPATGSSPSSQSPCKSWLKREDDGSAATLISGLPSNAGIKERSGGAPGPGCAPKRLPKGCAATVTPAARADRGPTGGPTKSKG